MAETADYDKSATPTAHHTTHENGGADKITVLGLSGLLADPQVAIDHAITHQNGGFDEISVAGLSGLLADGQTPLGHKTSHQAGGADVIDADTLDTLHASAFSLTGHNHAGVYEPVIAPGTSAQYWRGDKTWQTLNQAAVAGLLTTDGPTFDHLHLSDLASIYTPAESWLGPSSTNGLYFKGGNAGLGTITPNTKLQINGTLLVGAGSLNANTFMQVAGGSAGYVNYNSYYLTGNFYTYQGYGGWEAIGSDAAAATLLAIGGFRASQWDGVTLHAAGSEKARINSTGLGVGKTPTALLDVAGQIRTDVTLTTGAKAQARYFPMNINGTVVNILTD